jgi:uncharacterized protein
VKYRPFGKAGWMVSALGFGIMRLPLVGDDKAKIDEEQATEMVRYAIDHGVNYFDTAYPYHEGQSERFLGRALQGGYRDKIHLATKMPVWLLQKHEDLDRLFEEQLQRLQTDHIDCYLFHGLSEVRWKLLKDLDAVTWAEAKKAKGQVSQIGFSFHDRTEAFFKIVDEYNDWDFCQIQYNLIDWSDEVRQAGRRGLEHAAGKGLAVVVMEPIRGGVLAAPPPPVMELWDTAPTRRTPAEWALQWVWNHAEVSVVLSGMSNLEQVKQNITSAEASAPGQLTPQELDIVERVRAQYVALGPIPCTGCSYCQPCPNGVKIPKIFDEYNAAFAFGQMERSRRHYRDMASEEKADKCIECGECENACPQQIGIIEWLKKVHEVLAAPEAK